MAGNLKAISNIAKGQYWVLTDLVYLCIFGPFHWRLLSEKPLQLHFLPLPCRSEATFKDSLIIFLSLSSIQIAFMLAAKLLNLKGPFVFTAN